MHDSNIYNESEVMSNNAVSSKGANVYNQGDGRTIEPVRGQGVWERRAVASSRMTRMNSNWRYNTSL